MVTIRPAKPGDEQGIAHLRVHSWQCTYHGIIPDEALRTLDREQRLQHWQVALRDVESDPDRKTVFVAEDDTGEIVGFVCGGTARGGKLKQNAGFDSELYAIHVDDDFQGRGIGQKLFFVLRDWLIAEGFRHMFLWAFADNPFIAFYDKIGGTLGNEEHINNSVGVPLKIVRYDWYNLKAD